MSPAPALIAATRRGVIGGAGALAAGHAFAATPFNVMAAQADDMALGDPRAPVTVIEYGSVGCPHCGKWANEVFPGFKAKFIDTGKARFVLREVITGQASLATAGFLLARCAGPAKYFTVVEGVFAKQDAMFAGQVTASGALGEIAKGVGIDDAAFHACLTSQQGITELDARSDRHANVDGVGSTPTFFVAGKKLEGELTLDQLAAAIAAVQPRRRRRRR